MGGYGVPALPLIVYGLNMDSMMDSYEEIFQHELKLQMNSSWTLLLKIKPYKRYIYRVFQEFGIP